MKNALFILLITFYCASLYSSCASQQPVTGGPKDTIPPLLLETYPVNKSVNFNEQSVSLTFDEFIKEDQIQTKLIVTPDDQNKFEATIKKNTITLEFDNPFKDSTTYTINFNSSIEDITENNEAENIILAFSTTTYIDSLSIGGAVNTLLTSLPVEGATVALYQANDTTDIFNKRPLYFSKTDEEGNFSIENLKRGSYRIYAFVDDNKNNLCEPDAEPHGFIADTLNLIENIDSLLIPITRSDVRPLAQLTSRVSGTYFESRYNKPLKNFELYFADTSDISGWKLYANLTEDARGIIFFPADNPKQDSVLISIHAFDSTGNSIVSDTYLKFEPSKRSPQKFTTSLKPEKNSETLPKTNITLTFNKPILTSHVNDSLFVAIDTIFTQHLLPDTAIWNTRKNTLNLSVTLDPNLVTKQKDKYTHLSDSLQTDTASTAYKQAQKLANIWSKVPANYTNIKFNKATFISVDGDSSASQNLPLKFINSEEKGIIRGTVVTSYPSYTIELIDKKYATVKSLPTTDKFEFKNVAPGDYSIRLLVDENQDGRWSSGNSLKRIEPEKVFVFPEFFNVRANWIMENIAIEF